MKNPEQSPPAKFIDKKYPELRKSEQVESCEEVSKDKGLNQIGEIRGIAPDQNLDPQIQDVLDEKLSEFPDREKYEKKTADMKLLTKIDKKQKENKELTKEELKFLYEIENKIEGLGYEKDPRIEEIKEGRDIKEDISLITGFSKEQISVTEEEALKGGVKFHYGDINLRSLHSTEGLKLPETINDNLYLDNLQYVEKEELRKKYSKLNIV